MPMGSRGYARVWLTQQQIDVNTIDGLGAPVSVRITKDRKKAGEAKITWEVVRADIDDESFLAENAVVRVEIGYVGGDAIVQTYVIRNVEVEQSSKGTTLTLTCKDKLVALQDIVWHDTWHRVRASDVALAAAQLMGLRAEVTASEVVYETLSFGGSSISQMLTELADDEDYDFGIKGDTLYFRPASRSETSDVDFRLVWGGAQSGVGGHVIDFRFKTDVRANVSRSEREIIAKDEQEAKARYQVEGTSGTVRRKVYTYYDEGGALVSRVNDAKVVVDKSAFEQYALYLKEVAPSPESEVQVPAFSYSTTGGTVPLNDQAIYSLGRSDMLKAEREKNAASAELNRIRDTLTADEYNERKVAIAETYFGAVDTARRSLASNLQAKHDREIEKKRGRVSSRVIEQSPIKDPTYLKHRNESKIAKAHWRKRTAQVTIIGKLPEFGQRFEINRTSENRRGPWLVRKVSYEWSKGDLIASVECRSPKPSEAKAASSGQEGLNIKVPAWIPPEWENRGQVVFDEGTGTYLRKGRFTDEQITDGRIEMVPYESTALAAVVPAIATGGVSLLVKNIVDKRNTRKKKVPK